MRLDLIVEHQAGIPLLMKPLSGHASDASDCGQVVSQHLQQLHLTYGTTCLVADSALYSEAKLHKRADTGSQAITRVPATLTAAQAGLAQANPEAMAPLTDGSRDHVVEVTDGGVVQRWGLMYSEHRRPQAQRTVDRHRLKQGTDALKAFKKLCRTAFACEADAQLARPPLCSAYRPRLCLRRLSVPCRATASGADQAKASNLTRWCTGSKVP